MSQHGDFEAVRKDIVAQLKKPDYDDGSAGPVFVRLAWYALSLSLSLSSLGVKNPQREKKKKPN